MNRSLFSAFASGFAAGGAILSAIRGNAWWALVMTALAIANAIWAMHRPATTATTDSDE
jgi:hypothetical protein